MHLKNLDPTTRQFMVEELDRTLAAGDVFMSSWLTESGAAQYPALLRKALAEADDAWLGSAIADGKLLKKEVVVRPKLSAPRTKKVPYNAPQTLAEANFNHFYVRGVCRRAIAEGREFVCVYRAKQVAEPRSRSQALIGQSVNAEALLSDLRSNNGENELGVPGGCNSGISVCLG